MCDTSGTTEKQGHSKVYPIKRRGPSEDMSRTTEANLDFVFVENTLVVIDPKMGDLAPL